MANTPNLNLIELIYDNTKKVKDFFMNEIIGKTNSNNTKIDTAIAEKITQVTLKSSLPTSPTTHNNLYIVYGDTKDNNGQYRWNGTTYEKISTQLDYATKSEAEAGADNTKVMTPQRVRDFFMANGGGSGGVTNVVFQSGKKYYKYTATAVTDNFEIPSNLFNPTTDVVELIHGGNIPLIKDENYTLVGNLVTFIGYSLDINDDIHCLITNTAYSYKALVDTPDLTLKLDTTGDAKDTTVTFTESTTRENLVSGDKASVLWGKVKKWFTDIWIALADKADVQWMSDGWKTENDSALTYPRSATTYFKVGTPSTNFPAYGTIKTELNSNGAGKQEVFGLNGQVVKYRLVKNDDSWGEWQIIATSADLEQKADKPIIGRYTGDLFAINGDCTKIYDVGYLTTVTNYPPNAPHWATLEYAPFATTLAKLTWIDYSDKGTVFECLYNPTTKAVVQNWRQIATTDKIDILSIDLRNGWQFNSATFSITKNGNTCNINVLLRSGTYTANTVIMNIPEGFRPTKEIVMDIIWYNSSLLCEPGLVSISNNGDITILKTPTYTSNLLIAKSYNLS